MDPSMSEKKSDLETKTARCTLCEVMTEDFLELEDFSDSGFILCANCEAVSTSEDLYGVYNQGMYAGPREGVFNNCPYPRTSEIAKTSSEIIQEPEAS